MGENALLAVAAGAVFYFHAALGMKENAGELFSVGGTKHVQLDELGVLRFDLELELHGIALDVFEHDFLVLGQGPMSEPNTVPQSAALMAKP